MPAQALNRAKYTNALLYFIAECGNEKLGITKLNKLFYYLDFVSFRDRGKPVTGERYIHLPMGPLAESLEKKILAPAEKAGLVERARDASEKYGTRNRFRALRAYDAAAFDDYERALLARLCEEFRDLSTDQMIALTHSEAPWVFSKPNAALDYQQADDIELFPELAAKE